MKQAEEINAGGYLAPSLRNATLIQTLQEKLAEMIGTDPENNLPQHGGITLYESPLVGIADASDPLFATYLDPEVIGPEFILPEAWLPGAKSVISYFLPFSEPIRVSNRPKGMTSQEWMSARIDGEQFNRKVRAYLVSLLEELGEKALAPASSPDFKVYDVKSNWSERHVAYAAGLGTFGHHRGLITEKGTAGRFGSVVTTLELTPTPRSYQSLHEYCPYPTDGRCGACISRCPVQAIQPEGKDKASCRHYLEQVIFPVYRPRYGCAKCNTAVPCEHQIPNF